MPIYDYQCQSCQYKSEVMRKVSAPSTEVCPECGQETFSKQLSAPSFQLNGNGWYATDFKNSGTKPSASVSPNADNPAAESVAAACQPGCSCH